METKMNVRNNLRFPLGVLISLATVLLIGCSTVSGWMGMGTSLSGSQEVPPVTTSASGKTDIKVKDDHSVTGGVTVSDMKATAAHIHDGAPGKNGGVAVPLTKTSDNTFTVPANTKLTDAQYSEYKAGNLYVNVHSAAHPSGEIRAQLKP
jgi:CHRD domain-containing protein